MKQEIKARWVKALRSGDYVQGTGRLRNDDSFCCLGVLCDLHSKETGTEWEKSLFTSRYFGGDIKIPIPVIEWSGIHSANPDTARGTLASINDSGYSFESIADIIQMEF